MLDRRLRPIKDHLLGRAADFFYPLSPNAMTLISFLFGAICVLATLFGAYGWAVILWIFNRILDGMDGVMARRQDAVSDIGGLLDFWADIIIYALIPVAFASHLPDPRAALATVVLLASFYINVTGLLYLSAILEKKTAGLAGDQTSIPLPSGLIEGAETMILFTLFFIFPYHYVIVAHVMAGLVFITAVQRLIKSLRLLRQDT
jgi:phosphatidylglycerophosphate synthase